MPATFEIFEPHLKKYIEIRSIPRFDKNRELLGLIHIVRDISLRKKIEAEHNKLLTAVTKAKMEWEMTFDSVMEYIVLIDKDLKITRCNKSFSDYVGIPADELIGYGCYEFFPCSREYFDDFREFAENTNNSGVSCTKKEIKTDAGRWLYVYYRPIKDDNNKILFSVVIATDITELKNAQKKIEVSEKELKKKVQDLEKFYDMAVGRELRMKELKKEIKRLKIELSRHNEFDFVNN